MIETDADWLRSLREPDGTRDAALEDLRKILLRGLRAALSGRSQTDDAFHQDMVQESLLRILDRLDQFEGRSRFVTWSLTITIRHAYSALRRKHWQDFSLEALEAADAAPFEFAAAEEGRPDHETRDVILKETHRIMQSELTARQRSVLLSELQGVSLQEVARVLGAKPNAVYKLGHDARQALKRGLERAGYNAANIFEAFPA